MANPFYVPRNNSRFQNVIGLANLATQLYSLKQHGDIAGQQAEIGQERNRLTGEDIAQRGQIAERTAGLQEEQNRNAAETNVINRAKLPVYAQPYGYGDHLAFLAGVKKIGVKADSESSILNQTLQKAVKERATKGDVMNIISNDPDIRNEVTESLSKEFSSGLDKDPNFLETRRGQELHRFLQAIGTDEGWDRSVKSLFPGVVRSMRMEEDNSRAALAEARKKRFIATDQGIFNTETESVYPGTGKLVPPEKPTVVPAGASLVMPGKTAPAYTNPKQENEPMTEAALTDRALKGDTQAKAILDQIQKRKLEIQEATFDMKSKNIDIPSLAEAVANGQDAPMSIKGSMGNPVSTKVKSEVLKKYPKFRFDLSDANYKWKQSATNQRTINFAGGSLPRIGALDDQLSKLPNVDINIINKVMATVSKQFGKPEYTNYESNRNAIVQEVNTALSGTSQASDLRIKIELENLESARSPQQIRGAISNLREALIARMDVDLSPLYPLEVVQGKKTIDDFKKEMFAKYRGKYGVASQASEVPENQPASDMEQFWKR